MSHPFFYRHSRGLRIKLKTSSRADQGHRFDYFNKKRTPQTRCPSSLVEVSGIALAMFHIASVTRFVIFVAVACTLPYKKKQNFAACGENNILRLFSSSRADQGHRFDYFNKKRTPQTRCPSSLVEVSGIEPLTF